MVGGIDRKGMEEGKAICTSHSRDETQTGSGVQIVLIDKAKQSKAKQSKAKQNKTKQSKAKQSRSRLGSFVPIKTAKQEKRREEKGRREGKGRREFCFDRCALEKR